MPPHVQATRDESDGTWLPLIEYSVKTGVSLSTIRRKIKSNGIQYRLEKGRYLILFSEANNQVASQPVPQQTMQTAPTPHPVGATSTDVDRWQDKPLSRFNPSQLVAFDAPAEEEKQTTASVEKAVNMVSEAFEYALVQKEERIRMLEQRNRDLEERINELKLLVRVIEEKYKVRY
jgi:DNA-binding transcriptional MerR regulator